MSVNSTGTIGAYTSAAAAYDGYKVSNDLAEKIKNGESNGTGQKVDEETALRLSEGLKKAIEEIRESKMNPSVIQEGKHGAQMIAAWQNQNAKGYLAMNGSDKANTMLKAYTQLYDEIERGYAEGTRTKYVEEGKDENGEKILRKATREDEIAELNRAFEGQINRIANQNSEDIFMQFSPDERNVALSLFKNNMMDITALFAQQYSQKMPGTFDIEGFLKSVSIFK